MDGADPCYTPWSTFYVGSEYLMWWTRGANTPPLVTTGPTGARVPGGLGQPGTVILDGNDYVLDDIRWGLRFNTGVWFDEARCFGVDGNFFFLGEKSESSSIGSLGSPEIARPLIFNLENGQRVEGTQITASPGIASGRVDVSHSTELWGAEANFRTNLFCTPGCFVDLLVGWRTLNLEDDTRITEFVSGTRNGITGNFLLSDVFQSNNSFNGGQIGLAAEHRLWDRWTLDWRAKIAMGSTRQRVDIAGATQISGTNTAADGLYNVGVLALPPNIGSHSRNVFSVVPEVQVNLGYQINPYIRTYVGYNFMYWSNVARASEHINRNINPNFLAPPVAGGPNEPSFNWKGSGFWAQGMNFGLEFRW